MSHEIFLINDGHPIDVMVDNLQFNKLVCIPNGRFRAFNYVLIQIFQCLNLLRLRKRFDVVFILPTLTLLPVVLAKVLGKKIIVMAAQNALISDNTFASRVLRLASTPFFSLSDFILVESTDVAVSWTLDAYKRKIRIGSVFVDTDRYALQLHMHERKNFVGYVGNLMEKKGVGKLVLAIPEVLNKDKSVHFLIGGKGPLADDVLSLAKQYPDNVTYLGEIPEMDLPDVLNRFKLLVLPSFTEGLPNIVLEAMACGTPVLASSVGGIPDVVRTGETGFLLKTRSPSTIAEAILVALSSNLETLSKNARKMVEKNYSYTSAKRRYQQILFDVNCRL